MSKQFVSSYMGEFDYTINGKRYRQRVSTSEYERSVCNVGVFEREVLPCVGTVRGEPGIFPPPEVMAEFPGYVPARWNPETKAIETDGTPDVVTGTSGTIILARAWRDELAKYGIAA